MKLKNIALGKTNILSSENDIFIFYLAVRNWHSGYWDLKRDNYNYTVHQICILVQMTGAKPPVSPFKSRPVHSMYLLFDEVTV